MVAHLGQWHLVLEAALAEEQSLSCCITNEVVRRGDVEKIDGRDCAVKGAYLSIAWGK
jgi:hypothetical protein